MGVTAVSGKARQSGKTYGQYLINTEHYEPLQASKDCAGLTY